MNDPQKLKSASEINEFVKKFKKKNKNIDKIIASPKFMQNMNKFKGVMDNSTKAELDYLLDEYTGFYEFAKFLENFASAVKDGVFNDIL